MMWYDPMEVNYESDEHSEWPVPELDQEWSRIDQLRWQAGCIKARTGITIRFNDGASCSGPGYSYKWPEVIGVLVGGSSTVQFDRDVWLYLNGVEVGAWAANQLAHA